MAEIVKESDGYQTEVSDKSADLVRLERVNECWGDCKGRVRFWQMFEINCHHRKHYRREELMRHAWLQFHRRKWHLLTDTENGPIRTWADRDLALTQLADEGWSIEGPHPKKLDDPAGLGPAFHGYALTRIVQ